MTCSWAFVLWLNREIVQVSIEMIWSSWICQPRILTVGQSCIWSWSHCSKLGWWIFTLIGKIHPVIAVNSYVTYFSTNLASRSFILEGLTPKLRGLCWIVILLRLRGVELVWTSTTTLRTVELVWTSTTTIESSSTLTSITIVPSPSSVRTTMMMWLRLRTVGISISRGKHS